MAVGKPVKGFAGQELLSDLALELDAVCAVLGRGLPSFESPARPSILSRRHDVLGAISAAAKLVSNCSDKGAAIVGAAAMDSLDELRAGAITARGGPPSAAKLHNQAIGGHLVE